MYTDHDDMELATEAYTGHADFKRVM